MEGDLPILIFCWDRSRSELTDDISPVLVMLRQKHKTLVMVRTTCGHTDFYQRCRQLNESDCNQATAARSTRKEYHKRLRWIRYTGCPRRNGQNFGRVFLMLKYTDITQNAYIQSWTVTEIMAREVWNFDSCYTLTDYQIRIKTGRNMWFL